MSEKSLRIELTAKDQRIAELELKYKESNDFCGLKHNSLLNVIETNKTIREKLSVAEKVLEATKKRIILQGADEYGNGNTYEHYQFIKVIDKALKTIRGET